MNSVEFAKGGNIPKGHTKVLETEDFSYYSDENGEYIIMIRKSDGSVASDNYFAENDLYERMVEIANGREKYVYISPESKEYLKEYIEDYAKGGMIDTHLKQFQKRYKKDGVDVSKTYDKDRIQMISDDYNKLDLINNHEYMDMGYLDVYTDGTYILYSPRDFYEKGGKVFSRDEINENDLDTIFVEGTRYDGDMFSENQETTDIDYVIDNWKDNRNVATYKIYLRFNNGDEKELVEGYSYAKGGTTDADYWKENKGDFAGYMEIDETEVDDDYIDRHFAKGGDIRKSMLKKPSGIKFDDSRMMKKLWNERGYDIPYLESLSKAELKGVYDTEFYEEKEYNKPFYDDDFAKGGKVYSRDEINENDLDTIFVEGTRYDGDMFSENQETTDIDYVIDNWKDNRNVATYKIYLRFNNGDEKELVEGYSYAKGGKIQINPNNHRYHILGYVKFSQKPELLATTNDKSEIKRIVNKIDFDKDKIFVTDDKEDRVVYNY